MATRHNVLDTLVVSPEGSLEVVTSSGRTIPVGIPRKSGEGRDDVARTLASSLSMTFDEDYSMGRRLADRNIMKLSDPVGSKCTAVFEDGESMRVSTDFTIRHELSRRCFEALSYALSAAGFFIFERELLAQVNGLSGAEKANDDALWEVFLQLLLSMFGIPFPKKEHSPFETLSGEAERAEDPITRRLAKAVQDRHPLRQKAASTESGLIWAESLSAPDAASILLALHLVAQDCRLSLTRQLDLSKLAPLLMQIASRIGTADWRDYWVRLMPTAYTPSSEEGHGKSCKGLKSG